MSDVSNLLKKYDVQGPRYTSYPTVPYWDHSPSEVQWLEHLKNELTQSAASHRGAAIYIHLPFCESLCTFCACNKIITKNHKRSAAYIELVKAEWQLYLDKLAIEKIPVAEVHLGGGTPTFMTPKELEHLLQPLFSQMEFLPDVELSFESDPRVTTQEHLAKLYELGFRRISLGVQDYDPDVQQAIHRVQSAQVVSGLVNAARDIGYGGVNFDLVYGLPFQTLAGVFKTIEQVIAQRPDRIAFYAYAHVPWVGKTGQRKFDENDLPSGDGKRALYEQGRALLMQAGYVEIGMDHFALPQDRLCQSMEGGKLFRNFMGYTPHHVSPMIGLGVSSISDAWTCFAQNSKDIAQYETLIDAGKLPIMRGHQLTAEDLVLRRHVLNLMTRFTTSWAQTELFTKSLQDIHARVGEFIADGLIICDEHTLTILPAGRPFIRNICMAFDARLQRQKPDTTVFSKTI